MTLTEFLLARIAEDEVRHKRQARVDSLYGEPSVSAHMLAECEAKRWALSAWADFSGEWTEDQAYAAMVTRQHYFKRMAAVYADHPDYDPTWRL